MEKELLEQLEQWYKEEQYQEIVKIIIALPQEKRDYEVSHWLVEALYSLNRQKEALQVLEQIATEGAEDVLWWFQKGAIQFSLGRIRDAIDSFAQVLELVPNHKAAQTFLAHCQEIALQQQMDLPFQQRVEEFWQLFLEHEYEMRSMYFDQVEIDDISVYMGKLLDVVFSNAVFQLNIYGERFELSLSTKNSSAFLFPLVYWRSQAPEQVLAYWDFVIGFPPEEELEALEIEIADCSIFPDDVQVWTTILENGRLGIAGYSEALVSLGTEIGNSFLYLFVQKVLGELCMLSDVEYVHLLEEPLLDQSVALSKLKEHTEDLQRIGELSLQEDPLHLFFHYEMHPKQGTYALREDIVSGSVLAAALPVLDDYYTGNSQSFINAAMEGVVWGFIFYSCMEIEAEQRVNVRNHLEEELNQFVMVEHNLGECVGGASGYQYAYLDCVCYNLQEFLCVARQVVQRYVELYGIREAGFLEFRQHGRYFPLLEGMEEPAVLRQKKREEVLLQPAEAQQYLLREGLHGKFSVPDILHEESLELPDWQMSISARVKEINQTIVIADIIVSSPNWDRFFIESASGMGKTPKEALQTAASNFLSVIPELLEQIAKGASSEQVQSVYAGQVHKWDCYPGKLAMQWTSDNHQGDFWHALQDEVLARLGNQKICYIEFYGAKTFEFLTGNCRINQVESPEISKMIETLLEEWQIDEIVTQRQSVFLCQQDETWKPYPHSQQEMQQLTWQAAEIFCQTEYDKVLETLLSITEDAQFAEELFLFLPDICAQYAYEQVNYPEQLTLEQKGTLMTVYYHQLFGYEMISQAIYWGLDNDFFGEAAQEVFENLVILSSIHAAVEEAKEQGINMEEEGGSVNIVYTVSNDYQLR